MSVNLKSSRLNVILGSLLLLIPFLLIPPNSEAGQREKEIFAQCGAATGGTAVAWGSCVVSALGTQEIKNFFQGKGYGCGNEFRKLFNPCRDSLPRRINRFLPYDGGVLVQWTPSGIYYSLDWENLGGGGRTFNVYKGGQTVASWRVVNRGVAIRFSLGGCYFSPDGFNLGTIESNLC